MEPWGLDPIVTKGTWDKDPMVNTATPWEADPTSRNSAATAIDYLASSAKSGLESLVGTGAKIVEDLNPFTTSEEDAAVLYKNEPEKLKTFLNESPAAILSRTSRAMQQASQETMRDVSPSAQAKYGDLKYATTDKEKAAYLAPVKMVGDLLQSLPSSLAMGVSAYLTKGTATRVYSEAVKRGIAEEEARQLAIKAAAESMAKLSAGSEGAVGYGQQAIQSREVASEIPDEKLQEHPEYKNLVENKGYSPEAARVLLSAISSKVAGAGAGVVDAITNYLGGKIIGKVIGEGGSLLPRVGKGFLTEGTQEAVQGGLEQVAQNEAIKRFMDKHQNLMDGVIENTVQSFFVGGLMGGTATGVFGSKIEPATSVVPPEPTATITPSIPPQFDQPTVPLQSDELIGLDALLANIDPETLTDEDVAKAQAVVAKHEELRKSPPNPQAEVEWAVLADAPKNPIDDIGELGASSKQTANAVNYSNPNNSIDRMDNTFLLGPEGSIGLTPLQVVPQSGTYTLGQATTDRPLEYLTPLHQTIDMWRRENMPDSIIVLLNEQQFSNSALGWHYSLPGNRRIHVIVPAVLRSPSKGMGAFNANTQASAFYNASHEFGHALVINRFFGEVTPEIQGIAQLDSKLGLVSLETTQLFPEAQQAVINEFNAVKTRILNNSMSAHEFIDTWMSPGKLGRSTFLKDLKVAETDNAMAVVKAIVNRAVVNSNIRKIEGQRALKERLTQDFLSIDEYLAEQTARHAYKANWDKTSPLGQFFKGALDSLRKFFIGLKKEGTIAPGTAFTEWIEGLSKADRPISEPARRTKAKEKSARPPKTPAALKPSPAIITAQKKAAAKKKVQRVQHNVETDTDEGKATVGKRLVVDLVRSKVIEAGGADQKELLAYIRQKDWDEFRDAMQRHGKKLVKFELNDIPEEARTVIEPMSVLRAGISEEMANDPKIRADAEGEWQRYQFRSKYFKAHFGDWENDPAGSSKIRRGAIIKNKIYGFNIELEQSVAPPGGLAEIQLGNQGETYGGEPLIVFHSTHGQQEYSTGFERFSRGDIGFHFGTVRAAHVRANDGLGYTFYNSLDYILNKWETVAASRALEDDLGDLENTWMIPAVLNIRNPLYIGEESQSIWLTPTSMLSFLLKNNVITFDQYYETLERTKIEEGERSIYKRFTAVRQLLLRLGYDGIVYQNKAEGDTSYVAFHPNQIKSLLGAKTFSRSDNFHMELDLDASRPDQLGIRKLWQGLKNFTSDFPRMRRFLRGMSNATYHVLELQQLAHINPDVEELQFMNEKNGEYNRYKSKLQAHADSVVREWKELGKENFSKLNKFLLAEKDSKTLWYELKKTQVMRDNRPATWYEYAPNETTVQKAQEYGLDEELTTLALGIKNVLLSQLNEVQYALEGLLMKRYGNNPEVFASSVIPVRRHVHELRKVPFFPEGRFGNRMLIIEKKKTVGPGWEVVWREHFEDEVEWEKAVKRAEAKKGPDERIRKKEVSDQTYVLMALPTEFVDMAASELGLSDEQLEILMNILQPVKRDKVLGAYDQQRLGIKGYSTDAMRSFSNFTWHNSNLLAKLIYRADFNRAIRDVGVKLREAENSSDPMSIAQTQRLGQIKNFMEKTRDYVMAPPNEAQQLRALVSIGYLGLNIKTALLNTYGLITTWSDLTSRMGQVEGNKLFLKASKGTFQSLKFTSLNERRAGNYLSPEHQKALDQAIEEGVLSQSYAYHLAGMANAGNLQRLQFYRTGGKLFQNAIDVAMYIFRLTELSTRRASFLAEFESTGKETNLQTLGQPLSFEERYRLAVTRTNKLQNDYSLGNRVPFMRGFKIDKSNPLGKLVEPIVPLATVFMSFMQHMAFHTYGGYELGEHRMTKELGETPRTIWGGYTMKIWLVTLLLAGYEGLPGAENLLDLIEIAWRKYGGAKPIRQMLREMIQELEVDPQLAARGFGHNVAGFDISRSVGFGRMVPGTDVLAHPHGSMSEQVGNLILDIAGPTGGFIKFGLEAIDSKKGPKEAFSKLPGGAGNIYTAYKWSQEGVLAPSRAKITFDLETGQLRDLTSWEISGKTAGFNPTVVSQNREIRFNQYDRKVYWQERRQILVNDLWKARDQRDREAEADVKKAITEFNTGIPAEYKALRLNGIDLVNSMRQHQQVKRADEQQSTTQRRYRPLYEDIGGSYARP